MARCAETGWTPASTERQRLHGAPRLRACGPFADINYMTGAAASPAASPGLERESPFVAEARLKRPPC